MITARQKPTLGAQQGKGRKPERPTAEALQQLEPAEVKRHVDVYCIIVYKINH